MDNSTAVERIRAAVGEVLVELGLEKTQELHETLLIRNGLFCGRKFTGAGYEVVWFVEEDELKFYSPCGDLLKTTSAHECVIEASHSEQRRAA